VQRCGANQDYTLTHINNTDTVDQNAADKLPTLGCIVYKALQRSLSHRRIMLQLDGGNPAVITRNTGKTCDRSATKICKRCKLNSCIKCFFLNADGNHPPVTGGKIASSLELTSTASSDTIIWSRAKRKRALLANAVSYCMPRCDNQSRQSDTLRTPSGRTMSSPSIPTHSLTEAK
jgi:hypothetical protein